MHFNSGFREVVTLRDGTEVVLRLVRPDDKELFIRGLGQMSSESRYMRFFTAKNRLSSGELHYLTEVDQVRHFALGAVRVEDDGTEVGVGVARFVAFAETEVAEPAIAVIDAMHGKGLGRLLFMRLIAAARERGITQFRCELLSENMPMRELLHHISPEAIERNEGDHIVVKMPIPDLGASAPSQSEEAQSPVYRLFSMVAERLVRFRRVFFRSGEPQVSILDAIGNTPIVPLVRVAQGTRVPVWGKCEHLNPGGSVKDRMALAIVNAAEKAGKLKPGATLVEATAGNTGAALAMIAAVRGYDVVCVMPEKMSEDKRRSLRAMGVEVVITDNAPPGDPRNFQQVARRIAAERDAVLTDQFNAEANPMAHEHGTGPEIWEQCGGDIGAFVAGVGTGGTITGVGRFLKRKRSSIKIVLADPLGSRLAGLINNGELGADGSYRVEGIGSSEVPGVFDPEVIDLAETVTDEESFEMARRLVREEGLLVGGSAGTAVAAALRVAQRDDIDGRVVALLPDHFDRYQTTIFG